MSTPAEAQDAIPSRFAGPSWDGRSTAGLTRRLAVAGPVLAALLWVYGRELVVLAGRWWHSPDYVHGFLVIPFAIFLAWHRREMTAHWNSRGSVWGYVLVITAVLIQCFSAYISDPVFGPLSIIPCLAGVVMVLGGWGALRWLWPCLLFLGFMVPLPSFLDSWGNLLLQRVATITSTFLLQAIGVPAVAFGNVIVLNEGQLGVEEACSGLRSTMLFFAVSFGAAFLIRGIPEQIAVVLIAIPAAILANTIRIAATGLLHQYASAELAEMIFHDVFGFFMLPLAACFTWIAYQVTRHLLVATDEEGPVPMAAR